MFGMAFKMIDDRTNFSRVCHHGPAGCRADDGERGSSGSTHRLSAVVIMKLPYIPPLLRAQSVCMIPLAQRLRQLPSLSM